MGPVNLDDQAFWAPRTPLPSWSRAARRRRSGSARPAPLNAISSSGMLNGEASKPRSSPPSADDSVASLYMEHQTSEDPVSRGASPKDDRVSTETIPSPDSPYPVSPTVSATTRPLWHVPNGVENGFTGVVTDSGQDLLLIDPELTTRSCEALEAAGEAPETGSPGLRPSSMDGLAPATATSDLALPTATGQGCGQTGIDSHERTSPGHEWPADELLHRGATSSQWHESTVPQDDSTFGFSPYRPPNHASPRAQEHAGTSPPPQKRRRTAMAAAGHSTPMSASPQPSVGDEQDETDSATFEEWNGSVKLVTINGATTFQGQFEGDLTPAILRALVQTSSAMRKSSPKPMACSPGVRRRKVYTPAEDAFLVKLKSEQNLPWPAVHEQFIKVFDWRSKETLCTHYHVKLKGKSLDSRR